MPDGVLTTARLRLRPVSEADAPAIQAAAGDLEIADTMISIPHPYPEGEALRVVRALAAARSRGRVEAFVIEPPGCAFGGLIEVRDIDREHGQAELSFWLVPAVWCRGYMSEAVRAVVRYGIEEVGLNRLYAHHMLRNPASGRVLETNGFRREGILRQRVRKWGTYEDVALWAILAHEWRASEEAPPPG